MKLLITTIAAVVLVGCARWSEADQALVKAAGSNAGNIESVKQALNDGADVNAKPWGSTPLYEAALLGHMAIAELLIAEGADVNAKNRGRTPLHNAAMIGHKEIVELLIAKGADLNAKTDESEEDLFDKAGKTPLDEALSNQGFLNESEIVALLRKHGGKTGEELKAEGK
jgi:ankyrin repeat protein